MNYKKLSNAIQIAASTGNVAELHEIGEQINTALLTGKISILDSAALQGELEAELDALEPVATLDDVYAAVDLDNSEEQWA